MTTLPWVPPAGMSAQLASDWRDFYRSVLAKYGITPAEYRALYLAQRGRCFICRTAKGKHPDDPNGRGSRRLAVDHNHAIGDRREAVRALVCSGGDKTCNRILGWLKTPEALERGAEVLREAPAQRVLAMLGGPAWKGPVPDDDYLTGYLTDEN